MFKKTRWRLTWINAISYTLFLIVFLGVFYIAFNQMLNKIQQNVVESYAAIQIHRIFNVMDGPLKPPPNRFPIEVDRSGFYYVISDKMEILYGEELYEDFYKVLEQHLTPSDSKVFEKITYKNEKLLVMIQPIKPQGKTLGYVAIGQSVSNYDQVLERLLLLLLSLVITFSIGIGLLSYGLAKRAMKPIQRSFNLQREFVANASHELRTPLSVLTSSIELMEIEAKRIEDDKVEQHITDMKSEALYMNEMLNSLLYLAKSDQNQITLNIKRLELSDIIAQRVRKLSRSATHLAFNVEVEAECVIHADQILIDELLTILLKNAITYTEKGQIDIRATNTNQHVIIHVADTGIGIPEDELPYIFERFYRVDKVRNKNGTGLGLAIAKNIVELHKGEIKVSSKVGQGTGFYITLPIY